MAQQSSYTCSEPFAIVGISLTLPQEAIDEPSLWKVLEAGKNLRTAWPESRISLSSFKGSGKSEEPHTIKGPGAHFVSGDPAVFDAPFFGITTKEATGMNPQQRWALEAAYHAFENAGVPAESLRGSRTGVFATYMMDDFMSISTRDPDHLPRQAATGLAPMMIANRVSWYFGLQGPSILVETGCSSAMVAIDMACHSMRSGDADMALVLGSNMLLSPDSTVMLSNMNFLSPDSRSYSFDSRANGYARGEGVVALVLKPLHHALKDGDMIRAVMRATAQNQDGRTPILTQPSADAQEALIRHVYAKAGLGLGETRYFEAHGTGTPTGDVIEMTAIGRAFQDQRDPKNPLYVGSIKPNIGHVEGASAYASIVKAIMILEKGIIPPNALFEKMNPGIDAQLYNVQVPTKCIPWPVSGLRRISVNSFGVGGANAHAILDDAYHYLQSHGLVGFHHCTKVPALMDGASSLQEETHHSNGTTGTTGTNGSAHTHNIVPKLLVWSAADSGAIKRMVDAYEAYFRTQIAGDASKVHQLAYTLAMRRSLMSWRSFAVVDAETREISATKAVRCSSGLGLAFVFTGQGAQYPGMGLELLQYPLFEASLKRSDQYFANFGCVWSLFNELQNVEGIHRPESSQPLCTALQIALIELLQSFGIRAATVLGHSSGEIAAAYAAGALSHESACRVAYWRGQLAGQLREIADGAMMSVNLSESQVPTYLDELGLDRDTIYTACINSPTNVTLSGQSRALDVLKAHLDQEQIFAHKVNTGVAYHSPVMQNIADEYMERLGLLQPGTSINVTMVSSVSGQIVAPKLLCTPQYWIDNLVSPVRFLDAVQRIRDDHRTLCLPPGVDSITDVVEIGPHPALRRPTKDSLSSIPSESPIRYHSSLERSISALKTMASLSGALYGHGYPVSIAAFNNQTKGDFPVLIDCPPYPFDHERRYWSEGRLSTSFRLRAHSQGHLLGKRTHDWNILHPRWRNWLCLETMPWLADHAISDSIVCPGTGMAVMALEAVKQLLSTDSRSIAGFTFKQGQFLAPITIGETLEDATETELQLRPITSSFDKETPSFEARLFSYRDSRWTENFRADVQVQFAENHTVEVDCGQEARLNSQRARDHVEQAFTQCGKAVDTDAFYSFVANYGSSYGDSFRHLRDIKWDGQASAVAVVNMASAKTHYDPVDSPVHPAVLDAAVHLVNACVSKGLSEPIPTLVPQQFSSLWISARIWDQETTKLRMVSEMRESDSNVAAIEKDLYALGDDGSPLITFHKLTYIKVSRAQDHFVDDAKQSLLYGIAWKPQLSALSGQELQELCDSVAIPHDETALLTFIHKLEKAMTMASRKALSTITPDDLDRSPVFLRKYAAMLQQRFCADSVPTDNSQEDDVERLLQECANDMPAWRILPAIGNNLGSILHAEMDPNELFSADPTISDYYADVGRQFMQDGRFAQFLDLASHENPGLRMIELGAGAFGMAGHIVTTLQSLEAGTGQTRFSEYTCADISPMALAEPDKMVTSLACQERMLFNVLNLEKDPVSQGYEAASYDMIVASDVLHATADLGKTLRHLRGLLRPGGHLVLIEPISAQRAHISIGFGCLESWWNSSETWRQSSPLATERQWDGLMRKNGFSGTMLTVRDVKNEAAHSRSIMVTRAVDIQKIECKINGADHSTPTELWLLLDPASDAQTSLASHIAEHYPTTKTVDLAGLVERDWSSFPTSVVISLLEVEQPKLADLPEVEFLSLKRFIQGAPQILWVTSAPCHQGLLTDPHYSVATGLLRVIRSEDPTKRLVTLRIDLSNFSGKVTFIMKVLQSCFFDESGHVEAEFEVHSGLLAIARARHEADLDEERISRTQPQLRTERWQPGHAVALEVGTPGLLDTLRFREDPVWETELSDDEVEIKAEAWPISFRDLFIALGRLGPREEMGFECAGTVTRIGPACSSIQIGDRVVMGVFGSMRSHPRAGADAVFKIPNGLSLQEAVAVGNPGMTAYHALLTVARLQRGEKILIHSAAGATGQFAIGIANMVGAEVFATVSLDTKKQLLMDRYGIPSDHIFYSRNTSFAQGIQRVTNGYGVDVVLNSLSGESLRASWECIAPYGRFIEIGKVDIGANASLPMANFARNASFAAVDMVHIQQTNAQLGHQLMQKVLDLAASADFLGSPFPLNVYPVSQVEKAFRYMQSGKHSGRIVIGLQDDDMVSKFTIQKSEWRFPENASYVVAGGLGGLGRPITRWMAERGAKHLILLSRSGATAQAAVEIVSELREQGVNVLTPRCDVSSAVDLSAVLSAITSATPSLPPIKGCINATMVLQDSIFENMTHAQWSRTIQSKVNTSWNLHELLPSDLDFFILLSSVVGVYGSPGQSNYAAGCTFQDALARHRTATGHHASVSLDLGWMRDDGVVRESADLSRRLANTTNFNPVATADMLAIFDHYCDPALPPLTLDQSQLLVGASTPTEVRARGGDPYWAAWTRLFAGLDVAQAKNTSLDTVAPPDGADDFARLFRHAGDSMTRTKVVVMALRTKLARALGVTADEIDDGKGLTDYGVDSLMAVELRNWIQRDFEVSLAVFEIMQGGKRIRDIGASVVEKAE